MRVLVILCSVFLSIPSFARNVVTSDNYLLRPTHLSDGSTRIDICETRMPHVCREQPFAIYTLEEKERGLQCFFSQARMNYRWYLQRGLQVAVMLAGIAGGFAVANVPGALGGAMLAGGLDGVVEFKVNEENASEDNSVRQGLWNSNENVVYFGSLETLAKRLGSCFPEPNTGANL